MGFKLIVAIICLLEDLDSLIKKSKIFSTMVNRISTSNPGDLDHLTVSCNRKQESQVRGFLIAFISTLRLPCHRDKASKDAAIFCFDHSECIGNTIDFIVPAGAIFAIAGCSEEQFKLFGRCEETIDHLLVLRFHNC